MKLVADANVLLSAVLGGRAGWILNHPKVQEVVTTESVFAEVQEYAAYLARQKRLSVDTTLLAVATLPVNIIERKVFAGKISEAERRIGRRDADDVDTLALALFLGFPVWSNDSDFEDAGVEWYATAELLRKLAGNAKKG